MTDTFYDIVWLQHNKAYLVGFTPDTDEIEQLLTEEQREQVYAQNEKHQAERDKLYATFLSS